MVTQTLLEKAKNGDAEAFEQIYNETIKGAYYVARKFMGTDAGAEDVLQESYIKIYEKLGEYKTGNFQGWVDVIVANKCKDYLKRNNPLLFSEMESEDDVSFDAEETREEFKPDEKVDYEETKRLIKEIIDKLPIEQKMSVVMFYYEEMSVKEIAAALECSENTIKSRLNYGRKVIKSEVEELEKKGTKLYCAPLLPFLLWLFKEEAKVCKVPTGFAGGRVLAHQVLGRGTAGANIAGTAAKAGMSLGAKVGIATATVATAAAVVAGAVGATIALNDSDKEEIHPIAIEQTKYIDGEKETAGTLSRAEIDKIVEEYVEFRANKFGNDDSLKFVPDVMAYAYIWQGERPLIVIRDHSNSNGNADDAYFYALLRVDTNTGDVISYSEIPECLSYVEPNDEFLYNEDGFLLTSERMQTWCMEKISRDSIVEIELTESEYKELYNNYKQAYFTEIELDSIR